MHLALLLLVPLALDDLQGIDDLEAIVVRRDAEPRADLRGIDELEAVATPALFGLGPLDELVPVSTAEKYGATFTKYRHLHAGIPVDDYLVIRSRDGVIQSVLGRPQTNLVVPSRPLVSEERARALAGQALAPRRVVDVIDLHRAIDEAGRTAWRAILRAETQTAGVEIDAMTGSVRLIPLWHRAFSDGTSPGKYKVAGNVTRSTTLLTQSESSGLTTTRRLQHSRAGIATMLESSTGSVLENRREIRTTALGGFTDVAKFGVFVATHAALGKAREYMRTAHGIVLAGKTLVAVGDEGGTPDKLHYAFDPHSTLDYIRFPFEQAGSNVSSDVVTFDCIAHEVGHAFLWRNYAFPHPMSGPMSHDKAIAESIADMIAVATEELEEGDRNWAFGEDLPPPERYLDLPSRLPNQSGFRHSDAINDAHWNAPYAEEHTRSGPHSRFMYLLSEDPDGLVTPVGFPTAMSLMADVMELGLAQSILYDELRDVYVDIATERCGSESQLVASVSDAWHAVDNGPAFDHAGVSPPHDAVNVAPWPTTIRFPIDDREVAWTVELDTDPALPAATRIELDASELTTGIASVKAPLRPSTTYFWRVRAQGVDAEGDPACASPIRSFTTGPRTPTVRFPVNFEPKSAWSIDFVWYPVKGALKYRVDIFDRGLGVEYEATALPSSCTTTQCAVRVPMLFSESPALSSAAVWSVTAFGPTDLYDPNEGAPGQGGSVSAREPQLSIVSPLPAADVNPWKQPVDVTDVGAADYVEVTAVDLRTDLAYDGWLVDLDEDRALVSSPAYFDEDGEEIRLEAVAVGPPIQPVGIADVFVQKVEAAPIVVKNRGSRTIPCLREPWDNCGPGDIAYVPADNETSVAWDVVTGADNYLVTLYSIYDDTFVDFAVPWRDSVHPAGDTDAYIFGDLGDLGEGIYGRWVSVQGYNADIGQYSPRTDDPLHDVLYDQRGEGPYLFELPFVDYRTPDVIDIDGLTYLDANGQVKVKFVGSPYIYGPEGIAVTLYDGPGCDSDEVNATASPSFGPGVLDEFDFAWNGLEYEHEYSTRMWQVTASFQPPPRPSECFTFVVASEQDHYCGNGVREPEHGEQCDDGDRDSGDGCDSDCRHTPLPCGSHPIESGVFEATPHTRPFTIGQGTEAFLVFDTIDLEDQVELFDGNVRIFDSGCISTNEGCPYDAEGDVTTNDDGSCAVRFHTEYSDTVTVKVTTGCGAYPQQTKWSYRVACMNENHQTIDLTED